MNLELVKQQQVQLLAQKALLQDQLKQIDTALGQLAAILQFAEQSAPAPAEPAPETE